MKKEKIYVICWADTDMNSKETTLFGVSGACKTMEVAKEKLWKIFESEKAERIDMGLIDEDLLEENGEDFYFQKGETSFRIDFSGTCGYENFIEYEIKELDLYE